MVSLRSLLCYCSDDILVLWYFHPRDKVLFFGFIRKRGESGMSNPLFAVPAVATKKVYATEASTKRAPRSDKIMDLKFPVTPEQNNAIRNKAKLKGKQNELTEFCTDVLLKALDRYLMNPDFFIELPYEDTHKYKTTKPTVFYHDQVFALSGLWNCSMRQVAHRLFFNMLERGDL